MRFSVGRRDDLRSNAASRQPKSKSCGRASLRLMHRSEWPRKARCDLSDWPSTPRKLYKQAVENSFLTSPLRAGVVPATACDSLRMPAKLNPNQLLGAIYLSTSAGFATNSQTGELFSHIVACVDPIVSKIGFVLQVRFDDGMIDE